MCRYYIFFNCHLFNRDVLQTSENVFFGIGPRREYGEIQVRLDPDFGVQRALVTSDVMTPLGLVVATEKLDPKLAGELKVALEALPSGMRGKLRSHTDEPRDPRYQRFKELAQEAVELRHLHTFTVDDYWELLQNQLLRSLWELRETDRSKYARVLESLDLSLTAEEFATVITVIEELAHAPLGLPSSMEVRVPYAVREDAVTVHR